MASPNGSPCHTHREVRQSTGRIFWDQSEMTTLIKWFFYDDQCWRPKYGRRQEWSHRIKGLFWIWFVCLWLKLGNNINFSLGQHFVSWHHYILSLTMNFVSKRWHRRCHRHDVDACFKTAQDIFFLSDGLDKRHTNITVLMAWHHATMHDECHHNYILLVIVVDGQQAKDAACGSPTPSGFSLAATHLLCTWIREFRAVTHLATKYFFTWRRVSVNFVMDELSEVTQGSVRCVRSVWLYL